MRTRPSGIVWVVRPGDGPSVADILRSARADEAALREGRVFVGRRRARTADEAVGPGDDVRVTPKRDAPQPVRVLADEDGLLAVDKPAGVVTIPDQGGAAASLLAAVARFARVPLASLHATSRLDREVSGVVLFARTPAAVARLRAARDGGTYSRRYVAIASGTPAEPRGRWAAPIGRGADPRHRAAFGRDAVAASSDFAVVACAQSWTLLALSPVTGRTHQLRVHAAHAGVPLVGDRVYGGPCRLTSPSGRVSAIDRIALHAARVRVPRSDGGVFEVIAEPPSDLTDLWRAVGGDDAAWGAALAE